MKIGGKILFAFVLALNTGIGGCSGKNTIREVFRQTRVDLEVPMQDLLLESMQILSLLENYRSSLEEKDLERYMKCFSGRFSYYEKGLEWVRSRARADYFRQFDELSVDLSGMEIMIVKKERAFWLKQEAFNWLESDQARSTFPRPYLIRLRPDWGGVDILFSAVASSPAGSSRLPAPPARAKQDSRRGAGGRPKESSLFFLPTPGREPEEVMVRFQLDPLIEAPLGEVSFNLSIRARSGVDTPGKEYEYTLKEKVIFLLEKEEGGWKIISRE